ncbi:MAG: hypothetical protein PHW77_05040 [Eubacteriales bacterium]|nr:hypothetical protein [Eubacteriales bacterium]
MKKASIIILNTFSVLLVLIAVAVSVFIFATDNRYSEPIFGDTMLLTVHEDDGIDNIKAGSLAIIDMTLKSESEYYASFLGNGTKITRDKTACIGTVKGYIPYLGGIIDFFRNPLGFFLCIVLPLTAVVIRYIIKIVLLTKGYGEKKTNRKDKSDDISLPKGGSV